MSSLPEVGARVGVAVHDWKAVLDSTVVERGGGAIAIRPPSDGQSEYDLPKGVAVALEWASLRGLMRVRGQAAGRRGDGAVAVELRGEPQISQRREFVRANAIVQIVAMSRSGGPPVRGLTIDVSGGGVQARFPGLHAGLEQRLNVEIQVPDGQPVEAGVRVTRKAPNDVFSLAFDEIEPNEQERLIRFVFQKLRAALKAA